MTRDDGRFDRRSFLRSAAGALGAAGSGAAGLAGAAGSVAAGGSYTNHVYSGFDYWRYVPDGVGAGDPLVVMLHGCSQHADQFRRETGMNRVADAEGFAVIYPDQYDARNASECWNWFYDSNTTRGNGEAAVIAGMALETVDAHDLDGRRVYVAGLSAGGAMVPNLLVEYADVFAAGGVHSGLEYDAAETATGGTYAMTYGGPDPQDQGTQAYNTMAYYGIASATPTVVFHGTGDTAVYPINGHQATEQATQTIDLALDDADDGNVDYDADAATSGSSDAYDYTVYEYADDAGRTWVEKWMIEGMGHAWSGGSADGEYTAPGGPDASRRVWEFCSRFTLGE